MSETPQKPLIILIKGFFDCSSGHKRNLSIIQKNNLKPLVISILNL